MCLEFELSFLTSQSVRYRCQRGLGVSAATVRLMLEHLGVRYKSCSDIQSRREMQQLLEEGRGRYVEQTHAAHIKFTQRRAQGL